MVAKVAIVEDDQTISQMYRFKFEAEGFTVETAENGKLGLELAEDMKPDIILLDLMMPEMDGFDFVDELRRNEDWRELPVVVVTAKALTDEERRRLNGHVERIIQRGRQSRQDLLTEIRDLVARVRRQHRSSA